MSVPLLLFLLIPGAPPFQTPEWVPDAIFYQIFPERFANGDPANDPPNTRPWRYEPLVPPEGWFAFYGGDLWGVIQKLDYLDSLGITAIYLNPVFTSPSNHKYDAVDYYRVDSHFGGNEALIALFREAGRRGIRVILDGVFNHTADEHPFFQDVRRRGPDSPYYTWYIVKQWPFPEKFDETHKPAYYYACWWGFGDLPKVNHRNPRVNDYFLGVAVYWLRMGASGWRLDVPNEVPHRFWRLFRKAVKATAPNAYLVGEIWGDGTPWLQGDEFDAVMNYPFREALIRFLIQEATPGDAFAQELHRLFTRYPQPASRVLFNLLGSHDTERFLTLAGGEKWRLKLAVLVQMTVPGAPVIYYGDEVGMLGGKDPDCRRVMVWDPLLQDQDLLGYYRNLIRLRKGWPALRRGELLPIETGSPDLAGYLRATGTDTLLVLLNRGAKPQPFLLPPAFRKGARELVEGHRVLGDRIVVPPQKGMVLVQEP